MYTFGVTPSRCSLCYALLYTTTTSSTISSSSLNKRYGSRCSKVSIERIIFSSRKFRRLWNKNDNRIIHSCLICFQCRDTMRQIEQIKSHIEQLHNQRQMLLNKLEHNLYKRALILQGKRKRKNYFIPLFINHQVIKNFLPFTI